MSAIPPPPIPVPPGDDGPPAIPTGAPPVPPVHPPGYGGAPQPMPAYGEAPPQRIANPGWRALAFFIDGFGTFALTTVLVFAGLFTQQWVGFWAIPIVPVASFLLATVLTATLGVTPGKALVGIRVVHVTTGRRIGAWAIVRSLVIVAPLWVSSLLLSLAGQLTDDLYFSVLAGYGYYLLPAACWIAMFVVVCVLPRHRGIEDILARSVVVRSR